MLYINGNQGIRSARAESYDKLGFVNIDTTLELVKNDKVDVRFYGKLHNLSDVPTTTYFEGRMIARLNK